MALIKIDPADVGEVNPSIPFWCGPTGTGARVGTGAKVISYGNSELLGVLSTLALAPIPASNGVGDITKEPQYLAAHGSLAVTLANGTPPFRGALLPA
jgi:hypothetical protein